MTTLLICMLAIGCSMTPYTVTSEPPGGIVYYRNPPHLFNQDGVYTHDQRTPFSGRHGINCGTITHSVCVQWDDGTKSEWRAVRGNVHFLGPQRASSDASKIPPPIASQQLPCDPGKLSPPPVPVSLAVLDFLSEIKKENKEGAFFADFCRETVHKSGAFILVERDDMRTLLSEEDFVMSFKCDDTKCLVDFGRKLQAQKIVQGRISKLGGAYFVQLKLVDVGSAVIEAIGSFNAGPNIESIPDAIRAESCQLLRDSLSQMRNR